MAPRRLVTAMLVLLAISTVVALLVPNPPPPGRRDGSGASSSTGARTVEGAGRGDTTDLVDGSGTGNDPSKSIEGASGDGRGRTAKVTRRLTIPPGFRPGTIPVTEGRPLVLEVRSKRFRTITIPELGLTEFSDPYSPAVFDLLPTGRPGTIEVTDSETGSRVVTLAVRN